jgi:ABC-type transporter MlaC component
MAITQRSEFASIIDNNGGNVDALLQKMRAVVG